MICRWPAPLVLRMTRRPAVVAAVRSAAACPYRTVCPIGTSTRA